MSSLVPFNQTENLPAYLQKTEGRPSINKDVVTAAAFPTMSIRGKRFTVSRDGIKKVLMKPDEEDEVAQHIGVVVLRANMHAKVFYLKKYAEGDSDGARPDCYSLDGIAPSPNSPAMQAKKCGACVHNVWGSRIGDGDQADGGEKKGKACADNARLAISPPDKLEPMLLRVPPASLKSLREAVKLINQRDIPYNAVVMKIGFDIEASSPKLTFKPIGLLSDAGYAEAQTLYEGEVVRAIVGADDLGLDPVEPIEKPPVDGDELDAALAARAATDKAASPAAAAKPATKVTKPAAKPPVDADELDALVTPPATKAAAEAPAKPVKAAAAPAPAPSGNAPDSLLSDLDALLGNTDD